MRTVMSAIKDSVMAAGLHIATHDENGELLGASQVGCLSNLLPVVVVVVVSAQIIHHFDRPFSFKFEHELVHSASHFITPVKTHAAL